MSLDYSSFVFVFTAGVFALFSPCGFPMLPGYIAYYLGAESSTGRAISCGFACLLGLVAMFSFIGVMTSILGSIINPYIPLLELVAGVATILLGISILGEIKLPMLILPVKAPKRRRVIGIFLYGVAYGLATIGCSAPIFFSILIQAVSGIGPFNSIIIF